MKIVQRNSIDILSKDEIDLNDPAYAIAGKKQKHYQISYPIDMIFETIHPDNYEDNFISSYLSPEISFNSSMNYDEAVHEVYSREAHHHDYFELLYVIRGQMYQLIEHKRHLYPEGSLCLLNRNIYHCEEFTTDFRAVFLSLTPDLITSMLQDTSSSFFTAEKVFNQTLLQQFFINNLQENMISLREYMDFIPYDTNPGIKKYMYSLFEQLTVEFASSKIGSTYAIKGLLLRIFSALSDSSNYHSASINIGTELEAQLFDKITSFMSETNGRITRSQLEQKLNYNGAYLNKIVKKYTELSIFNYGMIFCMKEAKQLLASTDMNIGEIAEQLGFSNRTHFYKIFQDFYKVTPKEFRISVREK